MADQRITQLTQLSEADVASTDVLPIVDISASETKKVTAKDLFEAGATLADSASIDLIKLNQSSATKLGTTALADDAITAAKLANDSSINYGTTAPASDNFEGRGHVSSSTKYFSVWDGSAFQQVITPTAGIEDLGVTTGKIAANAVTTAKIDAAGLGTAALANNAVTTAKIADDAVTVDKLGAGAVDTTALLDDAVTTIKVADDAVTYAKVQNVSATDKLLGRVSAGAGNIEEITCTAAGRALLDDADATTQRTTLGLGTLSTQSGTFSGTHSGTTSGTNTGDQTIALIGDVTGSGTGTFTATVAAGAITTAKILDANVTTGKLANGAVTGPKLAADSSTIVSGNTPSGSGDFEGQGWVNTNTGLNYVWTGAAWQQVAALQTITFSDTTPLNFAVSKPDDFSATITTTLDNQTAGTVLAGPTTGAAAAPTFRALAATDLPIAVSGTNGVVQPGTGLSVTGAGVLNHTNSAATGTFTKVTIDAQGHVTTGTTLAADDIPSLDTSKLTTGTLSASLFGTNSITGVKLANASTVLFGGAGSTSGVVTFPTAEFKGQYFYDELNQDLYIWSGSAWLPVTITAGELVYAGTYNANTNLVASVTSAGSAAGLTAGAALPAASSINNRYYVVVSQSGTGSGNAPPVALAPPDMVLSNGATWDLIDVSNAIAGQTASNISFTPYGGIAATNVQTALQELDDEKLGAGGGTITGQLLIGTTGSVVFEGSTADAYETTLAVVDPTSDHTVTIPNITGTLITTGDTGTVTSTMLLDGTIVNGDINASAAIAHSKLANITAGSVLLGNATNVPTATALSGDVTVNSSGVTAISSGVIVDADINASAAIADTKLATIATADKVSLSALNIDGGTDIGAALADADLFIVDDGGAGTNRKAAATRITDYAFGKVSGDITIGSTGTAAIGSGVIVNADVNASAAIAGTKISPDFGSQTITTTGLFRASLGTVGAPTITFTGDTNTGIYSPGADQVAISTGGTERMRITSAGRLLIGQTSDDLQNSNGVSFNPNGNYSTFNHSGTASGTGYLVFGYNGGLIGSITQSGTTAVAYNTFSDYRLKENVVPLTNAISRINQLQVHRFNFIADPDRTVDGFIAHEAQAVVPECVTGTKDEVDENNNPVYQGIDQSKLVPLLTAALQEAIGRIESLEAKVAALKGV
jgi:hypothetical protein